MTDLATRLNLIRSRCHAAAERAGRSPEAVELMAVSKTWPPESVQQAVDAGQTLFGENRVQEALSKIPALPSHLRWHLIGHLQSNKVRKILPHVEAIHSVTKPDLAQAINRIAGELNLVSQVYLEVNLGDESSKVGFRPDELRSAMPKLLQLPNLCLQGLMCIPPFDEDPEKTRPFFAALRTLRDDLQREHGIQLPGLSMGMSHDFETAIEEGSTMVRVGRAIFGER